MNHSAIVQPGSNMCVCGMPDDHPVHGFVEWVPKCRADRQCMAKEHDRTAGTSTPTRALAMCACGLLMYQPMALVHMGTCSTYRRLHEDGDAQ